MHKKPDIQDVGLPMATFFLLSHTGRLLTQVLNSEGSFGELTPSQFYTLLALDHGAGMPLSEISERIRRSPGNMTLVIDNLEKDGLVERQRSTSDRRVVVAALTAAGKEKIQAAKQAHRRAVEAKMQVLNEDELQTLHRILSKFTNDENEEAFFSAEKDPLVK